MHHLFTFMLIFALNNAYACFDMNQLITIGNDLGKSYEQTLCSQEIRPEEMSWVIEHSLPDIMNQDFLGVSPPAHWQTLAHELLSECRWQGSLCKKEAQINFALCAQNQLPLLLMVLSPWLNEHCETINEHLIQHWADRKPQLVKVIQTYIQARPSIKLL